MLENKNLDLAAESNFLGTIIGLQNIDEVIDIIRKDFFTSPLHRAVWQSLVELHNQNAPIDLVSVYELVRKKIQNPELINIIKYTPVNVGFTAKVLCERWVKRQLAIIGSKLTNIPDDVDIFAFLSEYEKELFGLSQVVFRKKFESLDDVNSLVLQEVLKVRNGQPREELPTGYIDLDNLIRLRKAESIIIAGRPSMGKTAFALNIAGNISKSHNVGFFSMEMSAQSLGLRYLASETSIPSEYIYSGNLTDAEVEKLKSVHSRIFIDDTGGLSISELRSKARKMKSEHDIKCLFIDYLQLLSGEGDNRESQVSFISRNIKALAKELDIPIVTLSQMNRSVEQRLTKRPHLSDLRESGAIEQDADIVMFVHRPEYYGLMVDEQGKSLANIAEVIVAKNRNGSVGECKLVFQKNILKFVNYAGDSW